MRQPPLWLQVEHRAQRWHRVGFVKLLATLLVTVLVASSCDHNSDTATPDPPPSPPEEPTTPEPTPDPPPPPPEEPTTDSSWDVYCSVANGWVNQATQGPISMQADDFEFYFTFQRDQIVLLLAGAGHYGEEPVFGNADWPDHLDRPEIVSLWVSYLEYLVAVMSALEANGWAHDTPELRQPNPAMQSISESLGAHFVNDCNTAILAGGVMVDPVFEACWILAVHRFSYGFDNDRGGIGNHLEVDLEKPVWAQGPLMDAFTTYQSGDVQLAITKIKAVYQNLIAQVAEPSHFVPAMQGLVCSP